MIRHTHPLSNPPALHHVIPPCISLCFWNLGVRAMVPPGTDIYPNYISDKEQHAPFISVSERQSESHIPLVRPTALTEGSSAELCWWCRYVLEPVREGRGVVPYLLRCHSQGEIKRKGWDEGELVPARRLARLAPLAVNSAV